MRDEAERVSRRSALAGMGTITLGALLAACGGGDGEKPAASGSSFTGANTCRMTSATTQGPYYFDADKVRGDIREDREGTKLRLAIKVLDSETCKPVPNAVVDIWHCDAKGLYSGAESLSQGGGGAAPGGPPTGAPPGGGGDLEPADDKRYLRGTQVTDKNGVVEFTTIWPGWYRGRTTHIHAMVHIGNDRSLTTQMMFDESLNGKVYAQAPYSAHTGRDTFNDGDNIFKQEMLLKVTEEDDGYLATINFGVDSDKDEA